MNAMSLSLLLGTNLFEDLLRRLELPLPDLFHSLLDKSHVSFGRLAISYLFP
jgi:hypothetical protein